MSPPRYCVCRWGHGCEVNEVTPERLARAVEAMLDTRCLTCAVNGHRETGCEHCAQEGLEAALAVLAGEEQR